MVRFRADADALMASRDGPSSSEVEGSGRAMDEDAGDPAVVPDRWWSLDNSRKDAFDARDHSQADRRVHRAVPGRTRTARSACRATSTRPARGRQTKAEAKEILAAGVELLAEYQARLAAQDTYGVLVVLQAMDAAGKDGTIRHVMSGVNPQGVEVRSFKVPSSEDLDHDYLWRYAKRLPERGHIGIFNRSYYEEVLVVRVHPQILAGQKLPPQLAARRHLEAPLPRDQRLGALPGRPGLPGRQAVPQPVQGGAAPAVPRAHRRAREELEVQRQRRQGAGLLGRLPEGLQRRAPQHEHPVGALVRHPGRRQAVRPGRRRRRPGPHADRDRPAATRRSAPRRARRSRPPRSPSRPRPRQAPRPTRSRPSWPSEEGAKKAEAEGEEVMTASTGPSAGAAQAAPGCRLVRADAGRGREPPRGRSGRRPDVGRGRRAAREVRPEHLRRGEEGVAARSCSPASTRTRCRSCSSSRASSASSCPASSTPASS